MFWSKKKKLKEKISRATDRAKLDMDDPNEVRYVKEKAKELFDIAKKFEDGAEMGVRASTLKRLCEYIIRK